MYKKKKKKSCALVICIFLNRTKCVCGSRENKSYVHTVVYFFFFRGLS